MSRNADLKTYITPRFAVKNLIKSMEIGLVPMLWGSPGIGKSASVQSIADQYNLELIDLRVSNFEPVDFGGLPVIDERVDADGNPIKLSTYLPFDLIPTDRTPLPKGKDGWLLFFDEINHGKPSTVAAMYKVLLDKKLGSFNIHPAVNMIAAGNTVEDRAMVQQMSTATKSRLCNLYIKHNLDEWIEDVALKNNYDYRVISYLSEFGDSVFYNFAPKDNQDSFCCPRSWSAVNRVIQNNGGTLTLKDDLAVISGLLSPDVALRFIQYFKLVDDMVTYEEIMQNPAKAKVPNDKSLQYATVTALLSKINHDNAKDLGIYLNRLDKTFIIMFLRMLRTMNLELATNKSMMELMSEAGSYFRGN